MSSTSLPTNQQSKLKQLINYKYMKLPPYTGSVSTKVRLYIYKILIKLQYQQSCINFLLWNGYML